MSDIGTNGQHHPAAVPEIDPSQYGPAMRALRNDRQRQFVVNTFLFETATGAWSAAGYGRPGSSPDTRYNCASRLQCDPRIQAAILEVGRLYYNGLMPLAIRQTKAILEDRSHPEHGKTLRAVLGFLCPPETKQTVDVHHTYTARAELAQNEELARRFAEELGIPVERFLGASRAKMIEGTATETNSDDARVNADDEQPENDEGN